MMTTSTTTISLKHGSVNVAYNSHLPISTTSCLLHRPNVVTVTFRVLEKKNMDSYEEKMSQPPEPKCTRGHPPGECYCTETNEDEAMDHEHEYLSDCCGAPESRTLAGFCRQCRNHAVFTCDCGESQLSRHDTARQSEPRHR